MIEPEHDLRRSLRLVAESGAAPRKERNSTQGNTENSRPAIVQNEVTCLPEHKLRSPIKGSGAYEQVE